MKIPTIHIEGWLQEFGFENFFEIKLIKKTCQ